MGGVAVATDCRVFMCPVVPIFIDGVHDMAIVAGGWVVSQVCREVSHIQAYTCDCKQGKNCDYDWNFHGYIQAYVKRKSKLDFSTSNLNLILPRYRYLGSDICHILSLG